MRRNQNSSCRVPWVVTAVVAAFGLFAAGCSDDDDAGDIPEPEVVTTEETTPATATEQEMAEDRGMNTADDNDTFETFDGEEFPTDSDAGPVDMPVDTIGEDGSGVAVPQPQLATSAGSAAYFGELIPWILNSGVESGTPDLDSCVAEGFVESFDGPRLDELAALADSADLSAGFGAEFLSEAEMAAFVANTQPCTTMMFDGEDIAGGMLFSGLLGSPPAEPSAEYEQAAGECSRRMAASDSARELILTGVLFDVVDDSELELLRLLLEQCDESLLVPLMAEAMAAEMGLDRETALCATEPVYRSLAQAVAVGEAVEESLMALAGEMLAALGDCGVSPADLMGTFDSNESAPGPASQP